VLRSKRHYFMADVIHAAPVAGEFLEHAKQEMERADLTAERIIQLSSEPNYFPDDLSTRRHAEYVENEFIRIYVRCHTEFREAQSR
jgi:bacterioferritin